MHSAWLLVVAEYTCLILVVAVGPAGAGPGDWSLDGALGLDVAGSAWAVLSLVVGLGSAAALVGLSYRPSRDGNPEVPHA